MTIFDIALDHERGRQAAREQRLNPYGLTPRQRRIASLLLDGAPRKNIALLLGETIEVIDSERRSLMRRTRARNAVHLIHLLGLLEQLPAPRPELVDMGDLRQNFGRIVRPANTKLPELVSA